MSALGKKMNKKVLNLFLRIFLSHKDSVVIMIRLDHLYTLALAAEWIEGALRPAARTAVVEVTDSSMSDRVSGSLLGVGCVCSGIMNDWKERE